MQNRLTLAEMSKLAREDAVGLPVEQIAMLLEERDEMKSRLADYNDLLATVLNERYGGPAALARQASGKDTGTVTITDGAYKVTCDLPPKVEWDQKVLQEAVETIASWGGEDPLDYVSMEIKVSEAKYKAWPPSIRKLFEAGRTVGIGRPTFKMKEM